MTGPSRDRPARPGRGTGSGGRNGKYGGDYDDLALEVDESDFFLVSLVPELSDFFVSVFVDEESDDVLSDFAPSFEPPSDEDSDLGELPFERFPPLRLSFL
jgi:hypothetical protein